MRLVPLAATMLVSVLNVDGRNRPDLRRWGFLVVARIIAGQSVLQVLLPKRGVP